MKGSADVVQGFRAVSVPHPGSEELLLSLLLLSQSGIVDLSLGLFWFCQVTVVHKNCTPVREQRVAVLLPDLSVLLSYLGVRLDTKLT